MNNQERLFYESDKFQSISQKSIGVTAERWLNIAYKLDYISLPCKEKIDALLRKQDEILRFHVKHLISDQDITDMMTITEIAVNTRFSKSQLNAVIC
jgi:hypothetical protein